MPSNVKTLFLLGATGFIGSRTAQEALRQGWQVIAIARNLESGGALAAQGVRIIKGDAARPAEWIHEVAGTDVLIDLLQPKFPARIGLSEIKQLAAKRLAITDRLLEALKIIPPRSRPVLFSVSGLDDLIPDFSGQITESSALRTEPFGFSHIGIPVRKSIEKNGINCAFLYLATVYGPGKAFADSVFPKIAAGKFRIPGKGNNFMPLVHVEDAALALVHLAGQPLTQLSGRSIVVADRSAATMKQFLGQAASIMGVRPPASAPMWMARLFAGKILCETLTRNVTAEPSTLQRTGFKFRYETYRDGLPPTLGQLGYRPATHSAHKPRNPFAARIVLLSMFALSIAAMLSVNLLDFPESAPRLMRFSQGLPLLDMRLHYTERDVYQLFDLLGPVGREMLLRFYWTVDLILPALFGITLWLAISRTTLRRLKWLAIAAAGFDYAENSAVTFLLLHYPNHYPWLARVGSAFTSSKWIFYIAAALTALTGIVLQLQFNRRPALSKTL